VSTKCIGIFRPEADFVYSAILTRPFLVWCLLSTIWGSTWLFIKVGVRDLPPLSFAGFRFLLAAVVLYAALLATGRAFPRKREDLALIALTGAIIISMQYGLIFWAEVFIPSGLTAILYTVMPLAGMVFAHAMVSGERLSATKVFGVVLGIAGVALVFAAELRVETGEAWLACFGVLVAAVTSSWAGVLIKARGRHIDALALTVGQMSFGCVPLLALGLVREGSPFRYHWTASAVVALAYLGLVGSALAFVLLYWLIKRMDVSKTQLIPLASTIVAVFLGWLVLGERLSAVALAGAATIFSGLVVTRIGFLRAARVKAA
jgi:drug/metabolite transporter (DMT)-like permease